MSRFRDGIAAASTAGDTVTVMDHSGEILAAMPDRVYARITNISDSIINLSLGGTAEVGHGISIAARVALLPDDYFECGQGTICPWVGAVNGIADADTHVVEVVEF